MTRGLVLRIVRPLGKSVGAFLLLYLLLLGTYNFWLPFFAEFLIVKTPLKKCDLIVVSAGSYYRVRHAIELLKQGYAGSVLLLGDERFKVSADLKSPLELATEEVLYEGVSEDKILRRNSTSTQEDASQAKMLMANMDFKSAIIVSDAYNMRRLAMVFSDVFRDTSVQLAYSHGEMSEGFATPDRWWKSSPTFQYVIKEWLKFPLDVYTWFKKLK